MPVVNWQIISSTIVLVADVATIGRALLRPHREPASRLAWIMAILYADPVASGLARSGEIRFEPECGLRELCAEWQNLTKRVIPL